MHIAAVMAALDVTDLDPIAKSVLTAVCCRANQHTGNAVVSTARLAVDVGRHRNTIGRARDRLVQNGYLTVEKRLGKTSVYRVNLHQPVTQPAPQLGATPAPQLGARKDSLEKREGAEVSYDKAENLRLARQAAIDDCPYCDDHGWLWRADRTALCSHRPTRAVTDLTVEQILSEIPAMTEQRRLEIDPDRGTM